MATLVRRDPLLLRFQVPERDAAQMHPGIKAAFRMRDDTREYNAQIVHVGAAADETTRMVSVTAEVWYLRFFSFILNHEIDLRYQ